MYSLVCFGQPKCFYVLNICVLFKINGLCRGCCSLLILFGQVFMQTSMGCVGFWLHDSVDLLKPTTTSVCAICGHALHLSGFCLYAGDLMCCFVLAAKQLLLVVFRVLWDFCVWGNCWHWLFAITVCKQTAFACVSRKLRLCSHLFFGLAFVFCFVFGLIGW